jgi:hypothetical protein
MNAIRLAVAAAAGAATYHVAVVLLGGVLAAVAAPQSYFIWFGRERAELAMALLNLASWALPVLVTVFLLTLMAIRSLDGRRHATGRAVTVGMLGAFLYWHVSFALLMASQPASAISFGRAFASTLFPAWWMAPNAAAPWLGLAIAVFTATRLRKRGEANTVP